MFRYGMVVKLGARRLGESFKSCNAKNGSGQAICVSDPQDINVEKIISHPECKPEGDWKNDLAILVLDKEPKLSSTRIFSCWMFNY